MGDKEHRRVLKKGDINRDKVSMCIRRVAALSSLKSGITEEDMMSLKVIHFQSIFLINFYLKRLIYVQKYGITHQTAIQQGIQEKEEFLQ